MFDVELPIATAEAGIRVLSEGNRRLVAATCRGFALALLGGNLFLHKPISDLCDAISARLGFAAYNRAALLLIAGTSLVAASPMLPRAGRWLRQPLGLAVALALLAMTLTTSRWLLVANVELVHFPQYGLLAGLLVLGNLAPEAAWLAATCSGVLDEIHQHLVIYAGRPDTYLDYNDMVLNAIGAAWVVILAAAARSDPAESRTAAGSRPSRGMIGIPLLITTVAVWADPPRLHPFYRRAATGFDYHVLSLGEAVAIVTVLWTMVAVISPIAAANPVRSRATRCGRPR